MQSLVSVLDFATVTIASQRPGEQSPQSSGRMILQSPRGGSPSQSVVQGSDINPIASEQDGDGTVNGNPVNGGRGNRSLVDAGLIAELREMIGDDGMVLRATELKVYECDGWTIEKSSPEILLRPRTTAEVSAILKLLDRRGIPFVPRGAGTGLSGGCLPLGAPVMICTSRMNRILAIDYAEPPDRGRKRRR